MSVAITKPQMSVSISRFSNYKMLLNENDTKSRFNIESNPSMHHKQSSLFINYVGIVYDSNNLFFHAYINQRKNFRYYKALVALKNGDITEGEFDTIEESCIKRTFNFSDNRLLANLSTFLEKIKENYPEELKYLKTDDIGDLLSIPPHTAQNINYKYFSSL